VLLIGGPAQRALADTPTTAPSTQPSADNQTLSGTETIVFLRHGEKPAGGLGQITPQGFNRAIALAKVLPAKFGKPDYLFAPDPGPKVTDAGEPYNYIRPLATIEPTAIALGLPVQTPCGFLEIGKLEAELTDPKYASATIFVAWEHRMEAKAAADLITQFGGDASVVPAWKGKDFDSLYVVKITRTLGQPTSASFTLDHEGLDNQSTTMPAPAQ
jgi:hypothetical protein